MKTILVIDIMDGNLPESGWGQYHIYVFRDGEFPLYVGKAEDNIIDRLEAHLGLTYRSMGTVRKLVDDNLPDSLTWSIDLYSIEECIVFVQRHFTSAQSADVNLAERSMILEFSPPLNRQFNPEARLLPSKYSQRREKRIRTAIKEIGNKNE